MEALLQQEMQGVAELSVPLLAEAHTGRNWLAAKGWQLPGDCRKSGRPTHRPAIGLFLSFRGAKRRGNPFPGLSGWIV